MAEVLKFPPDFLWGSAVSSYQVEGGIENSDWSRDFPAGRACDYYNRYEQYFDMAKDLGQNIHRFSLEWSRIEPEEGKFDQDAVEHYKKILLALKARGIKSMVTIWHWTNPVWFAEKGGWTNSGSSEYFDRYVKFISRQLDNLADFWITENEPMVHLSNGYLLGEFPPCKINIFAAIKVYLNLKKAHRKAYISIHDFNQKAKVGVAYNSAYVKSAHKNSIMEKIGVIVWDYIRDHMFLDGIKKQSDFIGLNYYFLDTIRFNLSEFPFLSIDNKSKDGSDMGWEIFPEGIYHVLKDLRKRYNKPVYITENGIADTKDKKRARYIIDHLRCSHKAISEGVDLRGYFHWSLLDNFEWTSGYNQKFGLIEVNFDTLETKIRPSALEYAKICKNNSLMI